MDAPEPDLVSARATRTARLIVALVLALLVHQAWRVGPTYDEHFYVATGYAYLQDGDFSLNREHPPLAKYMAGAPLLLVPGVVFPEDWRDVVNYPASFFYQRNGDHWRRNLFLARLPFCLFTAWMCWYVFRVASRRWGERAGLTALLLTGGNPNVLAHGCLAGLDGPITAALVPALVTFLELLETPSWRRALPAAVWFGVANLTKFTALALGPVTGGLALLAAVLRRRAAPLGWTAAVWFGGLGVFALGYGFEARSVNEAWAETPYVVEKRRPDAATLAPADLGEAGRAGGLDEVLVQRLRDAPSLGAALRLVGDWFEAGLDPAPLLAAVAPAVEADQATRKLAADALLRAPDDSAEEALDLFAALTDVRPPDLGSARAWVDANRGASWDRVLYTQGWAEALTRGLLGDQRPIPLFTAVQGVDYQLYHGQFGHGTYYRGRTLMPPKDFADGNPYPLYYLDVLLHKSPLPWLVVVGMGLFVAFRKGPGWGLLPAAALLGTVVALMLVFSKGKALMGVRYVLPVLPLLALVGGRAATRWPKAALVLATAGALLGLRYHPHHLMYFNEVAGGPRNGTAITVVGDDWGQGAPALGRWYAAHADEVEAAGGLHWDPYSQADPAAFGLERSVPVRGRPRGVVAVNAVTFRRELDATVKRAEKPRKYAWLDEYEPFAVLDHSILLFDTRVEAPGGQPEWARD